MNTNRLRQDLAIDPTALDVAAATQGDTYFFWAEQQVVAKKKADRAKINVELVENTLAKDCRKNPEKFGLEKVTEAAIQAAVKTHSKYQGAVNEFVECKAEHELLVVACNALEQRKRMIEILVTLHGQEYFAGPSVPRDLPSAYAEDRAKRVADLESNQRTKARRRVSNED